MCMLMRVGIGREKIRGTKIGKLKIAQRTRLSPKRGRVKLLVNVSSLLCIRFKKGRCWKKKIKEREKRQESVGGKLARKSVTYDAAGKQKINFW